MAKFFVNRPIVAIVIAILMILLGVVALKSLPIAQYPEITPPEVVVNATYTGASAVNVEQSAAVPVEQQVNGVENMIYMRSINANDGTMALRVAFDVGTNLDMANVLTQNRVSQANASLPEEVKRLGVTVKKALAFPLILVTLRSPKGTYDNNFLSNYATINVNDFLARIPGVGQITLYGGSDYAIRLWVRPDRLAQLGLTVADLRSAVQQQNVIAPGGQIGGPPAPAGTEFTYVVKTQGRLETPEQFGDIVVRSNPDGSQIRLKDVARLELGTQMYTQTGRLNGKPAAVIAVYQLPGSNGLEVVKRVKKEMTRVSERFPADLEHVISLDTTLAVTEGINEIVHTLFEAVLLVILVVFIFLQSFWATLIPLLTVPVSLIGAFILFPLLGFSVNVLSLLGLVLAIGIVVDDAIVVVEAVMHHIEKGLAPKEATLKAMEEVSGPVIAIALVLSAVFVPVAFIPGITGRLYQQFALTIAISVLFSAINALSLSPALAAKFLRPSHEKKGWLQKFFGGFNKLFDVTTKGYLGITGFFTRKLIVSLGMVGIFMACIPLLGKRIPGGFVPEEDQGYFMINVQLPDAASLQRTDAVTKRVEAILSESKAIEYFTTITGYSLVTQATASNTAFFFVSLKEWSERTGSDERVFELMQTINARFAKEIPEAIAYAFGPPAIPGLGTGAGFSMMLQDRSGGTPEFLAQEAQKFVQAASQRPEIGRVGTAYRASVPQLYADIDREKVLKLGLSLDEVQSTLGATLGGSYLNDFNRFGRLYKVYLQAEPEFRAKTDQIGQFYVRAADKTMVPMATLLSFKNSAGPETTVRFNLFRAAEITGIPAPGYSSAQALSALEATAKEVLPQEIGYEWNAMSYQEKRAAGTAAVVFVFALVVVFLILAAQYESWSLPLSVLLGTPFAVFGAFLGLFLSRFGSESYVNNVFAQIGLIMLIGLAAKNAILIVEFARAGVHAGKPPLEAAMEAAKLRFRPILMTAFAFILGVVPLLTAAGAGAEGRKVMGMSVFAGMLVATILGVVFVPPLFVLVEKIFGEKKNAKE